MHSGPKQATNDSINTCNFTLSYIKTLVCESNRVWSYFIKNRMKSYHFLTMHKTLTAPDEIRLLHLMFLDA